MESKDDIKKPFYQPKTLYAITINPDIKIFEGWKRNLSTVQQFNRIRKWTANVLSDYKYLLHFDISCPVECYRDKHPKLHLHGVLFIENTMLVTKFLLETLPYMAASTYVKIGPVTDHSIWIKYITKYDNLYYLPMQKDIKIEEDKFKVKKNKEIDKKIKRLYSKKKTKENQIENYLEESPQEKVP